MTRVLGLSPADLGEIGVGVPGQLLFNGMMGMDGEEPGMTPALR
jgi:hypothetical protein